MKVIVNVVQGFNPFINFPKKIILEIWLGSEFASDESIFLELFVKSLRPVDLKKVFEWLFLTNFDQKRTQNPVKHLRGSVLRE